MHRRRLSDRELLFAVVVSTCLSIFFIYAIGLSLLQMNGFAPRRYPRQIQEGQPRPTVVDIVVAPPPAAGGLIAADEPPLSTRTPAPTLTPASTRAVAPTRAPVPTRVPLPTRTPDSAVIGNQQPTSGIRPVLECVQREPDGSYTAFFGYRNMLRVDRALEFGPDNFFSPGPSDRGQPNFFQGSTGMRFLFWVPFDGEPLTWTLGGNWVTASRDSPLCPTYPSP